MISFGTRYVSYLLFLCMPAKFWLAILKTVLVIVKFKYLTYDPAKGVREVG